MQLFFSLHFHINKYPCMFCTLQLPLSLQIQRKNIFLHFVVHPVMSHGCIVSTIYLSCCCLFLSIVIVACWQKWDTRRHQQNDIENKRCFLSFFLLSHHLSRWKKDFVFSKWISRKVYLSSWIFRVAYFFFLEKTKTKWSTTIDLTCSGEKYIQAFKKIFFKEKKKSKCFDVDLSCQLTV